MANCTKSKESFTCYSQGFPMQPLLQGAMFGVAAGLTLGVTNVVTKAIFGGGWIDWTVNKTLGGGVA